MRPYHPRSVQEADNDPTAEHPTWEANQERLDVLDQALLPREVRIRQISDRVDARLTLELLSQVFCIVFDHVVVPQDVQSERQCRSFPRQECSNVPELKCVQVPKVDCQELNRQSCQEVPVKDCQQKSRRVCSLVPRIQTKEVSERKCSTVTSRQCNQVPKQVIVLLYLSLRIVSSFLP